MIKKHFGLQIKLLNRQLIGFGVYPFLFYLLAPLIFLVVSINLFERVDFAAYVYGMLPVMLILHYSSRLRNDFLKSIHTNLRFYCIKIIEYEVICLPFMLFLVFKGEAWVALMLLCLALGLSFVDLGRRFRFVIPTPFHRYPFEFALGFRKTYFLVLVAYVIGVIGVLVGNFFLSLFGLVILIINTASFYGKPEPLFFVWVYSVEPRRLIRLKMLTALKYTSFLCIPMTVMVCFFFVETIPVTLSIQVFGLLFVLAALLAKYSVYPTEISLMLGIVLGISVFFPAILFILIPLLYRQSLRRLNTVLK